MAGVRVDLVARIYRHSLLLNQKAAARTSVATLMSSDVERVTTGLRQLHECWGGLVDLAVAFGLLSVQLSYAVGVVAALSMRMCLKLAWRSNFADKSSMRDRSGCARWNRWGSSVSMAARHQRPCRCNCRCPQGLERCKDDWCRR